MQGYMYMSIFVEKWNTLEKEIIFHHQKKFESKSICVQCKNLSQTEMISPLDRSQNSQISRFLYKSFSEVAHHFFLQKLGLCFAKKLVFIFF